MENENAYLNEVLDGIDEAHERGYDLANVEALEADEILDAFYEGELGWDDITDEQQQEIGDIAEIVYSDDDDVDNREDAIDRLFEDIVASYDEQEVEDEDDAEVDETDLIDQADEVLSDYLSDETRNRVTNAVNALAKAKVAGLRGSGIRYKNRRWGEKLIRQAEDELAHAMADAEEEMIDAHEDAVGGRATEDEVGVLSKALAINAAFLSAREEMRLQNRWIDRLNHRYANMGFFGKAAVMGVAGLALATGLGAIGGAAAAGGILASRAARGVINQRAGGSRGSIDDFEQAYANKLEHQINAIDAVDDEDTDTAFDMLWASDQNQDRADYAAYRSKKNRHAWMWGVGATAAGVAIGHFIHAIYIDRFGGGPGTGANIPADYPQEIPAGVNPDNYHRFIDISKNWTAQDHYNWGRFTQFIHDNPDVANKPGAAQQFEKFATYVSENRPRPNVEQFSSALEGIRVQEHDILALTRLGSLEQMAWDNLPAGQMSTHFDSLANDFGADYVASLYNGRDYIFENDYLRNAFGAWYEEWLKNRMASLSY